MKQDIKNKQVIVIGPARSGTSVVAGILHYLGVDMGQGPNPSRSNPKGDFEDEEFKELNRSIYKKARPGSGCWFTPTVEEIERVGPVFKQEIEDLIRARQDKPIWGWKNPWNIMAAPLYIPLLNKPHIIFVFRDPLSIAYSGVEHTKKYEQLTLKEALSCASSLNSRLVEMVIEYQEREVPVYITSFQRIIENPEREVDEIAQFLGLNVREKDLRKIREFVIPRNKIRQERKLGALRWWRQLVATTLKNPGRILVRSRRRAKDKGEFKK